MPEYFRYSRVRDRSNDCYARELALAYLRHRDGAPGEFEAAVADALAIEPDAALLDHAHRLRSARRELRLLQRLRRNLSRCRAATTAALGMDPDWVEAIAFAWLAKRTLDGRCGNLPEVTGARGARVPGAIYPA